MKVQRYKYRMTNVPMTGRNECLLPPTVTSIPIVLHVMLQTCLALKDVSCLQYLSCDSIKTFTSVIFNGIIPLRHRVVLTVLVLTSCPKERLYLQDHSRRPTDTLQVTEKALILWEDSVKMSGRRVQRLDMSPLACLRLSSPPYRRTAQKRHLCSIISL